jgi:hypothetical protein
MVLYAAAATDQAISRWLAVGAAVVLVSVLLYAFLTRFHQDWDAVLREWTAERGRDEGDGAGPPAH